MAAIPHGAYLPRTVSSLVLRIATLVTQIAKQSTSAHGDDEGVACGLGLLGGSWLGFWSGLGLESGDAGLALPECHMMQASLRAT